ncbi:Arc family DNA-binding protein [Mesorhizobium sp. AaZ16]|uniref:Arc family DNA-binding protein n=1 Tax=Mesorhizobium sp. AaZ16 TaxID=3402289 RepID=UPI00374EB4AB
MARTDPQVNLRFPAELKERLEAHARQNKRSLTAEIVRRLEQSFHLGEILAESGEIAELAARDATHTTAVFKWMQEQQSATIRLLETIAKSDGHLSPTFMDALRTMIANKGSKDAGFPLHPGDDKEDSPAT